MLLRITQPYQEFPDYHRDIERLYLAGTILYITFQNLAEYWNAATRPQQAKGFGLQPSVVRTALETLLIDFVVLYEDHQVTRSAAARYMTPASSPACSYATSPRSSHPTQKTSCATTTFKLSIPNR